MSMIAFVKFRLGSNQSHEVRSLTVGLFVKWKAGHHKAGRAKSRLGLPHRLGLVHLLEKSTKCPNQTTLDICLLLAVRERHKAIVMLATRARSGFPRWAQQLARHVTERTLTLKRALIRWPDRIRLLQCLLARSVSGRSRANIVVMGRAITRGTTAPSG